MITRIELRNFQSHKNTVIDFSEGINVLTGESDNGKTAVIRAVKWVCENRPTGTDKLNSTWNKKFKEEMSVKLTLSDGRWVKRVRDKNRNGYSYFDGTNEVNLDAIGTDVPQIVRDILNVSDVNFQFQMDSPYLLSMSSSEASRYLNQIIHLDSIDNVLATAESNKRSLNSEQKIVDGDVNSYTKKLAELEWLDEANAIQKRIDKYDELISAKESESNTLSDNIKMLESLKSSVVDVTVPASIVKEIEEIEIPDYSNIEEQVDSYISFKNQIVDMTEPMKIVGEIESVEVPDYSELEGQIQDYIELGMRAERMTDAISDLKKQMPKTCPLCGSALGENDVCK